MTIDNAITHVRYNGVDVSVGSGDLLTWTEAKTFSYTPVAGAALEVTSKWKIFESYKLLTILYAILIHSYIMKVFDNIHADFLLVTE